MKKESLYRVLEANRELNEINDPDVLMEKILFESRKSMLADAGTIYVMKEGFLIPYCAQNATISQAVNNKIDIENFHFPIDAKSIAGYVGFTGEILRIPNVYTISSHVPYTFNQAIDKELEYQSVSMLVIPLKKPSGELLGVLQLINKKKKKGSPVAFTADDVTLISYFSVTISMAIERTSVMRGILDSMIKLSSLHDPTETSAHVNRVAAYATEIYTQWASNRVFSRKEIERFRDNIRLAAMLHDVGKIAIPDYILKSSRKITNEQRKIMESHTWKGAQVFMNYSNEMERAAFEVALTHHEHWDGMGYPGYIDLSTETPLKRGDTPGRKGNEIPLSGRIVAIADVYDALISSRTYKKAWTEKRALEEIYRLSGTQFDPELVTTFKECLPSIRNITQLYKE